MVGTVSVVGSCKRPGLDATLMWHDAAETT